MASTSQAKIFRKESELLQMLEDSTDSELSSGSLFHSDKSNSDNDSKNLGNNPEIVDDVQQGGANENINTGTWSNEINFNELEEHENLAGPNHNLPYGSSEKDFLIYMLVGIFVNLQQTRQIFMPNTYNENLVLLIQIGKTLTWTKLEQIWGL
jgi:hypothetical protein